ncbi:MAG: TIGR03013 family PEP-CTERM/XrtA system glycosyltransferase [Gammaproteobacteria bacterium]|nr:TIGR03013 family PEP-CTERM/XrtA system glycosyltransferase [Gammaproteobacteria bacterium]
MYRIFGHYVPKTMFIFGLFEALVLLVSVHLALFIGLQWNYFDLSFQISYANLPLNTIFFICAIQAAMFAMGLYSRDLRDRPRLVAVRIALSLALGLLVLKSMDLLLQVRLLEFNMQLIALACSFIGILSSRLVLYKHTEKVLKHKTVIVGTGEKAQYIERLRRSTDSFGVEIMGYVDISEQKNHFVAEDKTIKLESSLADYIRENEVEEIVVAVDDRRSTITHDELLECKMMGVNIIDVNNYLERQLGKISLDTFQPSSFVYSDGFSQVAKQKYKRVLDVVISSTMLLLSAPIMLLAVLSVLIESKGKGTVLYRQQRVGAHGKTFEILKFRSMTEDAEKDGVAVWAAKNDARVTKVGEFIRKTRVDELPQLFNVLKGEMSFVGPRPERPQIVNDLARDIPFYSLRHHVKPGITGWAQICYPYGASVEDSRQKLQFDLYYLKNYSFFLDLVVLVQTATVILWGKGAR